MTEESCSVVTSPSERFSATSRSSRRMILPERVFGSSGHQHDLPRLGDRPERLGHVVAQLLDERLARRAVGRPPAQDHERHDRLAGGRVGGADHRRLGDLGCDDQRRLDLGGGDVVPGDQHHVVDPAEQPQVAVLVRLAPSPAKYMPVEARPVRVDEALVVAPDGAQHATATARAAPGSRRRRCGTDCRVSSTTSATMPGSGRIAEPGLVAVTPGSGEIMMAPGLGLPPGVDDRAACRAPMFSPVPHPRLRVDRLADAAQQPQRRQVVAGRDVVAPLHHGADQRGRGVEDGHAVLLRRSPRSGPGAGCPGCPRT